jgi:hypothetical protein
MDKKKKTILLICAAIFIGSYFARSVITGYLRMQCARQQAQRPKPKSAPAIDPAAAALAAEAAALGNQSGFWRGHAYLSGRACAIWGWS